MDRIYTENEVKKIKKTAYYNGWFVGMMVLILCYIFWTNILN